MPGPQDQPVMLLNMAAYQQLRDDKKMKLVRLQANHYQLAVRKYDQNSGVPTSPEIMSLNREGVRAMAEGIDKEIASLNERIASLTKSKENLLGALIADMDALDEQAKKEGDI